VGEILSRRLATAPEQRFAELTAEVADLAEAVACVALHFKINTVIVDVAKVERIAGALCSDTRCTIEWAESQSKCEDSPVDTVISQDVQTSRFADAKTNGKSLQPSVWIDDVGTSEMDAVDELCTVRSDRAKVDAVLAEPKDATCGAENAIAARVLELHDRLGGFIKPHRLPLSQPPNQNT